ncbi:alpha/beta hydrolase [Marinibactrum halimedae]|uniref:Alpha/beta hydrolase n=1 Tax=Marinibactrum halimedae TaxID=1444977 RepID=A0AA37TCN0_9GAMM|nr:alpha/beta hydrolase [Marinibactrum halimedae]MCD9460796.1 alpha/beta hydrolase [Marinibactrum halimedae]GLS27385.1 hypothetical protein GCM10007877_31040 [Marinibactrum halimedae]
MIIISARKSFDNADVLGAAHKIKEIDLSNDKEIRTIESEKKLISELSGKKVLILVHGYNNEQDEVYDAYSIIERKISKHLSTTYDAIIGYSWPGGDNRLDWWAAKSRANSVARQFRFLLEMIGEKAVAIDVMSHSLGARVVLKALKQSRKKPLLNHYYCTAPAVDDEVFEDDEEFSNTTHKVTGLFVFHSKRDSVLARAYRVAEFDNALGLYGPEDRNYIEENTDNVFVVNCKKRIKKHGGYKGCNEMYRYMRSASSEQPKRFVTL